MLGYNTMTDIDKFADKIDSLIEKIKNIKYKFKNEDLERDADLVKEEALSALENWLELITEDFTENEEQE